MPKIRILKICKKLSTRHLLQVYKYEIDPTRTVGATERTRGAVRTHLIIHQAKLQIGILNLDTIFWHCNPSFDYFSTRVYIEEIWPHDRTSLGYDICMAFSWMVNGMTLSLYIELPKHGTISQLKCLDFLSHQIDLCKFVVFHVTLVPL